MAPKKKVRQSRMHAAIDAMAPYGYSSRTVQSHVKALLKEYGGDDCWSFIEADAYMVLLESILNEQEQEEFKMVENSLEANGVADEEVGIYLKGPEAGSSGEGSLTTSTFRAEGSRGSERSQEVVIDAAPIISQPPAVPSLPPVETPHVKKIRIATYGWISDDEADYDDIVKSAKASSSSLPQRRHRNP